VSKLIVAALREKGPPEKAGPVQVDLPLEARVSYALDCLDADSSHPEGKGGEALAFLRAVLPRLDDPELQSRVESAISDHAGQDGSPPASNPDMES
jgi:hypothetical protein